MTDAAESFQRWAESELGLTGARIDKELSGGNSNLTRLVVHDGGQLVMRSAPANTISPKAHLGVERERPNPLHLVDRTSIEIYRIRIGEDRRAFMHNECEEI